PEATYPTSWSRPVMGVSLAWLELDMRTVQGEEGDRRPGCGRRGGTINGPAPARRRHPWDGVARSCTAWVRKPKPGPACTPTATTDVQRFLCARFLCSSKRRMARKLLILVSAEPEQQAGQDPPDGLRRRARRG